MATRRHVACSRRFGHSVLPLTVGAALAAQAGCNSRTVGLPPESVTQVQTVTFQQTINRQIDILFMVDNSSSMLPLQGKLLANFPVFMNVLKGLPMGLPDVHIAVVSSDAGPGQFDEPSIHCAFGGDRGVFQSQPRGNCTTSPLNPGQTFLAASNNQTIKNYTGDISDAFTCIAALGEQGCGFESQLKSPRWALDPTNVPDGNQGFLRSGAYLAVILITNEDDCSVPDDSTLIDPTQTRMSDPLGPLWSFRCNEFGHLCNINGTMQPPPRGPATNLAGCVSNETATGRLTKLADEVAFLKGLKPDPSMIMVAAITGPAAPYSIELIPNPANGEMIANIVHSCVENNGEYADPSVRLLQWIEAFGDNGLLLTICADSFAPALMTIGQKLSALVAPQCIKGTLRDADPSTPALDPECSVTDRYVNDQGNAVQAPVPACAANGNTPPCWSLVQDTQNCAGALTLNVNRGTTPPPNGLNTQVDCVMCTPGVPQPGCP